MSSLRLTYQDHLAHLAAESARFRAVVADVDPTARVPACPDWDAADLLWHLGGEVQSMWAWVVRHRPATPRERPEQVRPDSWAGLLEAFDAASADLGEGLAGARPTEEAWTWAEEHTIGFVARRQALEAQVHRVDAEQTAGASTELDAGLCADGVEETLAVMYGGQPSWGSLDVGPDPVTVRVDLLDTDQEVWTRLGTFSGTDPDSGRTYADEDDLEVLGAAPGPDEPSAVISGTAADVHLWLWKRSGADGLDLIGDEDALRRVTAILSSPID